MNTNTMHDPDIELRSVLDALETCLAIPIVAGELDEWSDQVHAAWAAADVQIERQLTQLHPKQFKQIAKEDPELSAQVEKLKAEDEALEAERSRLARLVDETARLAPLVEPHEQKFNESTAQLVNGGIAFIGRFKKQQVALGTWFQEAFNRDRGVAD